MIATNRNEYGHDGMLYQSNTADSDCLACEWPTVVYSITIHDVFRPRPTKKHTDMVACVRRAADRVKRFGECVRRLTAERPQRHPPWQQRRQTPLPCRLSQANRPRPSVVCRRPWMRAGARKVEMRICFQKGSNQ